MRRCAVYARFSSDAQHLASIDDQFLACQRYAAHQGWQILPEHRYVDEALSGIGVEHRPGYQRLLAALQGPSVAFEILLVDDLSRLSRDAAEILRLVRLLQGAGVKLISVADGIETGTKLAKLAVSIKAVINELYLDDLRERTLRGLQGRFARGLHTGGRVYGYRSVPVLDPAGRVAGSGRPLVLGAQLVIDPIEAQIVRQIFEWFAGGLSLRAIAHRLNAQRVPFPAQPTQRGPARKGWATSAVRVILLNGKYIGRWVFGRREFIKDPVSGRRRAHERPPAEWQVTERPELRIVSKGLWEAVEARFEALAGVYSPRQARGRLRGRGAGHPSGRPSLFSGLLRCGVCGGSMVIVSGSPGRGARRFGCGFHREKGPKVCPNGLTVKVSTVESQLVATIRERVLEPEAVSYLVMAVNRHLEALTAARREERSRLETTLHHVREELNNVEKAILAGVVGETTAALLKEREARQKELEERLRTLERTHVPLSVDAGGVQSRLKDLQAVLEADPLRVNAFLRQHFEPITCIPVEAQGRRFYRAKGEAKGSEIIERLGLAQAFDFGGCGGWI